MAVNRSIKFSQAMAHLAEMGQVFPLLSWFCRRAVPWRTVWVTLETGGEELRIADLEPGGPI